MKRFFKILLIVLAGMFLLIQFYPRPVKNIETKQNINDISVNAALPIDVDRILKISCNDCHSNNTRYPWYSAVQPFAWWLGDHVQEGKKELNFSEFGSYSLKRKYKKFKEIIDEVEEDKMPLKSYTRIHSDAILSDTERSILINWAGSKLKEMESQYPADSLRSGK